MMAPKAQKGLPPLKLTMVEKFDADKPGFATTTRMLLDRGIPRERTRQILNEKYGTKLTEGGLRKYRETRWRPDKVKQEKVVRDTEAVYTECGGERGLDMLAFARIRELMEIADLKDANTIRLTVLKIRAQDLKEEEFRFKCGQKGEGPEPAEDRNGADEDAKTRRVMNKVREIFALPALPEDQTVAAEPQEGSPP